MRVLRTLLHLLGVIPITLSPVPLLGWYDDLLACPPPSPAVNDALLHSALLALLGAGTFVALALTRDLTVHHWEDEAVTVFAGGLVAVVCLAWPVWLIAGNTSINVVNGPGFQGCVPPPLVGALVWGIMIAPVVAPLLDGARGLVARRRGNVRWLPWFSISTVALLFGLWSYFAVLWVVDSGR